MADFPPTDPRTATELARLRTDYAEQRTVWAAERTLFAILRTGLAIAAGGTVVVKVLDDGWPTWVSATLAATFIGVGYAMLLVGLKRYRAMARELSNPDRALPQILSLRVITVLTIVLQVAVAVVAFLAFLG